VEGRQSAYHHQECADVTAAAALKDRLRQCSSGKTREFDDVKAGQDRPHTNTHHG